MQTSVTVDITAGTGYEAITNLSLGSFEIIATQATAAELNYSLDDVAYNGGQQAVSVTAKSGVIGLGAITVKYDGSATAPTGAGTYAVTVDIAAGSSYGAISGLALGDFTISKAIPTIAQIYCENLYGSSPYSGMSIPYLVEPNSGVLGLGVITVYYEGISGTAYAKTTAPPVSVGAYAITVDIAEGTNYTAVTGLAPGSHVIAKGTPGASVIEYTLADRDYSGTPQPQSVTAKESVSGLGEITVCYQGEGYPRTDAAPTNAGFYNVSVDFGDGTNYTSAFGLALGGYTISKAAPQASDLAYTLSNVQYDGENHPVAVIARSGITGLGAITVKYNGAETAPMAVGTYAVTADIAAGTNYNAATDLSLGSFEIAAVPPVNIAPQIDGKTVGTDVISLTVGYSSGNTRGYTITGDPAPNVTIDGANLAGVTIAGGVLTVPAGLGAGTYTAAIKAHNGAGTATMTVTIQVYTDTPQFTGSPMTITDSNTTAVFTLDGNYADLDAVWLNGNKLEINRDNPEKLLILISGYPGHAAVLGEAVEGDVVITLYKEFLATLPNGTYTLTVAFKDEDAPTAYSEPQTSFVISCNTSNDNGGGSSYTNASITPVKAAFDKTPDGSGHKDIAVTLSSGGYTLRSLTNGAYTLVRGTDYAVSGRTVTIKAAYLKTLEEGEHTILFDMSGGADPTLTVTVTEDTSGENTDAAIPFGDVSADDWFAKAVMYVFEKGLMNGTSAEPMMFSPDITLTRGMAVTVLWRIEGRPDASMLGNPFGDVVEGMYYTDAIKWAAENNIVNGYGDGMFGTDDDVTREQFATILYRYAGSPPLAAGQLGFADAQSVSSWAIDAMRWVTSEGLITGKPSSLLDPWGSTTRAEAAAVLHRFLEK